MLADEPTGSLDEAAAANLAQLLVELHREEQVALLVVTHAPEAGGADGRACWSCAGRTRSAPRGEAA